MPNTDRAKPVVFIIDDDENVLRSLRVVLMRTYTVKTASQASSAVQQVRAERPDVIVVDIKMPEHDGFWVFSEIRKFDTTVPIIFNSAYQDTLPPEDVTGAYAPFAYLPKNGNLADFQGTIQRALKSRGL